MKAAPHPLSAEMRPLTLRDLGWLTASLVIVIAPHALRAPWWLTLLTLCLYGWRFYSTINRAPLPSRWLVIAVAGIGLLGVWLEYRTLFGRQAGVILLMLFSGLKLLESRTHRDGAVAAFLGYFLIITNFLYTQSIPTALLMCVGVFIITATLVGFSAPQRALRANLRTTGDRKSTRLNSSHTVISYAVFCLKKKKKKTLSTINNAESCTPRTDTAIIHRDLLIATINICDREL